ncbi:MAG: NAD(P)H-dependent glycerol-3-phosphate dehydrogenase [Acidiferrobacteraceae bacterium]
MKAAHRGKDTVAVLGAGSWGSALAILIARNGYPTLLWGRDRRAMERMARERNNETYLAHSRFPDRVEIEPDLAAAARRADGFVLAVPCPGVRTLLRELRPLLAGKPLLAQAAKGMEPETAKRLSEVAREEIEGRFGLISGPTFAREVAEGLPTALTVASADPADVDRIAGWLRNERVRVYASTDVVGVEIGGAVKNVLAIAAGIADGLGFGANARAALVTRGLAELTRLGLAMGGRTETFMGLSGLGDLVLTCTDNTSRNRQVGLAIGRGIPLPQVLQEIGQVAEGVGAARAVLALARRHGISMPITEQVHAVLFEGLAPEDAVRSLLNREPRDEQTKR